jgi:hypothetical protein
VLETLNTISALILTLFSMEARKKIYIATTFYQPFSCPNTARQHGPFNLHNVEPTTMFNTRSTLAAE